MVIGDLKFFTAVEMRHENLFEASAAIRNVCDSRIKDPRDAGELVDNLVNEFVSDSAKISHSPGIALPDPLLVLVNVEQAQLYADLISLNRKTAFDQTFSADRRPVFKVKGS